MTATWPELRLLATSRSSAVVNCRKLRHLVAIRPLRPTRAQGVREMVSVGVVLYGGRRQRPAVRAYRRDHASAVGGQAAGMLSQKSDGFPRARSLSTRISRALSWYVASSCVAHNERKPRREGGAPEVIGIRLSRHAAVEKLPVQVQVSVRSSAECCAAHKAAWLPGWSQTGPC